MNHARLALAYGSNLPIRVALALASSFWCVGLVLVVLSDSGHVYRLMQGTHPSIWIAVFAANSAALWWRIASRTPRRHVARLVNATTCALWMTITAATMIDLGFLAAAGDLTLSLMALWVAFRTDLTCGDRETA